MSIICVDPILNSKTFPKFAVAKFSEKGTEFAIVAGDDVDRILASFDADVVCFDFEKFRENFGTCTSTAKILRPWSVKILYDLAGHKVINLNTLALSVLGKERTDSYLGLFDKVKSHVRSYGESRIPTQNYDLTQLIPKWLLRKFYLAKLELIHELYVKVPDETIKSFYPTFLSTMDVLLDISKQKVCIDVSHLGDYDGFQIDSLKEEMSKGYTNIAFNPVGAKTGRLTCKKNTLNIFTLPKEMRDLIVARPECQIVQYDFKAFHPRIAVSCVRDESFKERIRDVSDFYSLIPGDRDKNKIGFLKWLFAPEHKNDFNDLFHPIVELKNSLHEEAIQTGKTVNKFGRPLIYRGEPKHVVFQNYITSLEADATFTILKWLSEELHTSKSRILFPFHDAFVLEIHESEQHLIQELKDEIESFYVSGILKFFFPTEVKKGVKFGSLSTI